MIRSGVAFGIGVTVGVIAVGAVAYYIYTQKKKATNVDKEAEASKKFSEKLKQNTSNAKSLDELIKNQAFVELLTSKELTGWFKENKNTFPESIKMIISVPTEETLKGMGYAITESIDPEKNVIQLFYDDEKKEVVKIRLVNYANIESNLQAHLIEENGMIVVTA